MSMLVLPPGQERHVFESTDLPLVYRETLYESEHNNLVTVLGEWLMDSQFQLEIDEAAIIKEESENGNNTDGTDGTSE